MLHSSDIRANRFNMTTNETETGEKMERLNANLAQVEALSPAIDGSFEPP